VSQPNPTAIANAETLLRQCRSGEVTGFVAVVTDDEDTAGTHMGGHVNLTQTVCLLEDLKLRALGQWVERLAPREEGALLGVVDSQDAEE